MESLLLEFILLLDIMAFVAVVLLHLVKSTKYTIRLYAFQSFVVALTLMSIGTVENEHALIVIGLIALVAKVIAAPFFFSRLLRRFGHLVASASYLSTPVTLGVVLIIIAFAASPVFEPLWVIASVSPDAFIFNIAMVFLAVFLLINRRGVLSQIVAVLALENSIVLLALLMGVRGTLAIEMGIVLDIIPWMIISYIFLRLVYRQFGSLDTQVMRQLTED